MHDRERDIVFEYSREDGNGKRQDRKNREAFEPRTISLAVTGVSAKLQAPAA
jgi:hypothetical protein